MDEICEVILPSFLANGGWTRIPGHKEELQRNSGGQDITVVSQYVAKMKLIYPVDESRITFSGRSRYHVNFSLIFLSILATVIVLYQEPKTLLTIHG